MSEQLQILKPRKALNRNNFVQHTLYEVIRILSGDDYYNRNFDSLLCYYVTKYTGEALNESPRYNASYSNIELAENVSQNTVEEQLDNNNADALIVPVQITLNDSMQIWQYFDGMGYYTRADFLILVVITSYSIHYTKLSTKFDNFFGSVNCNIAGTRYCNSFPFYIIIVFL